MEKAKIDIVIGDRNSILSDSEDISIVIHIKKTIDGELKDKWQEGFDFAKKIKDFVKEIEKNE